MSKRRIQLVARAGPVEPEEEEEEEEEDREPNVIKIHDPLFRGPNRSIIVSGQMPQISVGLNEWPKQKNWFAKWEIAVQSIWVTRPDVLPRDATQMRRTEMFAMYSNLVRGENGLIPLKMIKCTSGEAKFYESNELVWYNLKMPRAKDEKIQFQFKYLDDDDTLILEGHVKAHLVYRSRPHPNNGNDVKPFCY